MRTSVAALVATLLLCLPGAARAGSRFDTASEGYQALPAAGRKLVEKLAAAVDGERVKAFLALMPDPLRIGQGTVSRADVRKAIRVYGSIRRAFGIPAKGTWSAETMGDSVDVWRGDTGGRFLVAAIDGRWQVTEAFDAGDHAIPTFLVDGLGDGSTVDGHAAIAIDGECYARSASTPAAVGEPRVVGAIDAKIARRVLRSNLPRIAFCYAQRAAEVSNLGGTVTVRLVIDATGQAIQVAASGVDDELDACVKSKLVGVDFPAPTDGATTQVTVDVQVGADVPLFNPAATGCDAVPADVLALAEALAGAVDRGDAAAFVAHLPARLRVAGKARTTAAIERAVAKAGSLEAWLGQHGGEWRLEWWGRTYALARADGAAEGAIVLERARKRAKVARVIALCAGADCTAR